MDNTYKKPQEQSHASIPLAHLYKSWCAVNKTLILLLIILLSSFCNSWGQKLRVPSSFEMENVIDRFLNGGRQYPDTVIAFTIRLTCDRKNAIKSISYSITTPDSLKRIIKKLSWLQLAKGISSIKKTFKNTDFWIFIPVIFTHQFADNKGFSTPETVETLLNFFVDKDLPEEKLPALLMPINWMIATVK